MNIQVSELIVRYLERLGINTIFGMPGAHILPVYDSLYDSGIQSVLVKHEQGAAFMAGGYARIRPHRRLHHHGRPRRHQPCHRHCERLRRQAAGTGDHL
jgi:hypothetical protein